jgi:hypothetical protein
MLRLSFVRISKSERREYKHLQMRRAFGFLRSALPLIKR